MKRTAIAIALALALAAPLHAQGQTITAYFSPNGHAEQALVRLFRSAHTQILAAIYDLTDREIANALVDASRRHVEVWVAMDASEARTRTSQYPLLARALGPHVALRHGLGRYGILHDKFAVVDGQWVATGSYNWSYSAEHDNWENLLIISDPDLAQEFGRDFQRIWGSQ